MGPNLGRLAVAMARGSGAYNRSRYERDQQDFERERALAGEQLNESFRRDQLDARGQQNELAQQLRRDQLSQQRELAEAGRVSAMDQLRLRMDADAQRARETNDLRRDLAGQTNDLRRDLARVYGRRGAGVGVDRAHESDLRAARTENRQAQTDYNQMLTRRPRQSQYMNPLTREPDPEGFEDARAGFVADSTEKAGARDEARRRLSLLEGIEQPEPTDNRAAAIAELEQLKSELDEALAAQPDQKAAFLRQYKSEAERINAKYGIRP